MQKCTVFFRADGSNTIGLGHIVRSLALLDMLKDNFYCIFASRNILPFLYKEIEHIAHKVINLTENLENIDEAQYLSKKYLTGKEIVVLDGYHFRTHYQQIIKNKGCKLVCIDDIHDYHFVADAIINHAGAIQYSSYSVKPYTLFYLGLDYALLRRSFLEIARNPPPLSIREKNAVFISMGGSDINNYTLKVLKRCREVNLGDKYYVVTGGAYLNNNELIEFVKDNNLNVELLSNLTEKQMCHYMLLCSKAITPPSTVAYEYLSVGGQLFLYIIADNQVDMYNYMVNQSLAESFTLTDGISKQNKKNNISCIDGFSKIRLIKVFNFLDSLNKIYCRKAIIQDAKIYFEWANDISVRANAINNDPIEYKNHIQWFTQKIMNDKSVLYYFEFDKHPLGQVRFDFDNEKAIIDYSVDKQFRNKGLGQVILYNAIYSLYEEGYGNGEILLFAQVKQSNISSIKVFNNLNFKQVGIQTIGDVNYYNFQK